MHEWHTRREHVVIVINGALYKFFLEFYKLSIGWDK